MKTTKSTIVNNGELSDGKIFEITIVCNRLDWLFGFKTSSVNFFTSSEQLRESDLKGVQIPMKILVDLRALGISDSDAKEIVNILGQVINSQKGFSL